MRHSCPPQSTRSFMLALAAATLVAPLLLSGCAASFDAVAPATANPASQGLRGNVHGGQAPVVGAAVYLVAASATGYGTVNTSLLNTGASGVSTDTSGQGYVTTGANGAFRITSDYTCPSSSTLVYLLALGGNPGLGASTSNPALAEIAALGPCGALTSSTFITINEVTTVAAMSALAPFTTIPVGTNPTPIAISTSATNILGLTNAFTTAANLASITTGLPNALTPSGLGAIPVSEINTLADILATCVNSNGAGAPCSTLFTATTPSGGTAPLNTVQAMLNITLHPAQNVTALFNLVTGTPPFQPTLPAVYNSFTQTYTGIPNDWSIAIVYTTPSILATNYLALDSKSNVWAVGGQNRTATQLSNSGVLNYVVGAPNSQSQLSANNYNQVLAVDQNDNLWVDNNSYGVTEISKTGALLTDPTANWGYEPGNGSNYDFSKDYVAGFGGLAIDATNSLLYIGSASNSASALVKANFTGFGLGSYTVGGIFNPTSIALDTNGNIWVANNGGSGGNPQSLVKISPAGTALSGASGYPAGNQVISVAIDHSNNAWGANYAANSLTAMSNGGAALAGSPFTGGGLLGPSDIAVDGVGNIWVSNFQSAGISEFSPTGTALSPSKGFFGGVLGAMHGSVAIDASGSIWASNWSGSGSVNQIVGVAAPTINPVAVATRDNTIGTRP